MKEQNTVETFKSDLSKHEFPISERVSGKAIRQSIFGLIQHDYPEFTPDNFLSLSELNQYREKHISEYLARELGELTKLEKTVLKTLTDKTTISDKLDEDEKTTLSIGQKLADKVATFRRKLDFYHFLFFLFAYLDFHQPILACKQWLRSIPIYSP